MVALSTYFMADDGGNPAMPAKQMRDRRQLRGAWEEYSTVAKISLSRG